MNWILGKVLNNPALILWIALASFAIGLSSGGGAAWTIQGWRLEAVQAKYDGFVSTTKALGDAAKVEAEQKTKDDIRKKEKADHENATTVATLHADIKRLRLARPSSSFLPPVGAASLRPDRACFGRPELERAIRDLDTGVQGIAEACDFARVNLDTAKRWAVDLPPPTPMSKPGPSTRDKE